MLIIRRSPNAAVRVAIRVAIPGSANLNIRYYEGSGLLVSQRHHGIDLGRVPSW